MYFIIFFFFKVIDLGFSKKFCKQNKIEEYVGTTLYIAPEIIKRQKYDEKCDVWSIGVIVYIMLCGYPPFEGESDKEIFENICEK